MVYTPHTWVERTGTGTDKAGWLNNMETQYDEAYTKFTTTITHSASYYTEAEADAKYWTSGTDGTGSGFVAEKLDGYTGAEIVASQVKAKTIVLWAGSAAAVPAGWQACDGTNGTPDLRGRFPIALGSTYTVLGTTGGADTVQSTANSVTIATHAITVNELPSHIHTHSDATCSTSNITITGGGSTNCPSAPYEHTETSGSAVTSGNTWPASATAHGHSGSTLTGDNTTGNNLPLYKAYCYIMKL